MDGGQAGRREGPWWKPTPWGGDRLTVREPWGPLWDAGQLAALAEAVSSTQPPAHSDTSPGLAIDLEGSVVLCFDVFLLCLILITHTNTHTGDQ